MTKVGLPGGAAQGIYTISGSCGRSRRRGLAILAGQDISRCFGVLLAGRDRSRPLTKAAETCDPPSSMKS
jgi:hypothetical protein